MVIVLLIRPQTNAGIFYIQAPIPNSKKKKIMSSPPPLHSSSIAAIYYLEKPPDPPDVPIPMV